MVNVVNISGLIGAGKTTLARALSESLRNKGNIPLVKLEETINQANVEQLLNKLYSSYNEDSVIQSQQFFVDDSAAKVIRINTILNEDPTALIILDTSLLVSQFTFIETMHNLAYIKGVRYDILSSHLMKNVIEPFLKINCKVMNIHIVREVNDCIEAIRTRNGVESVVFSTPVLFSRYRNYLRSLSDTYSKVILDNNDEYNFVIYSNTRKPFSTVNNAVFNHIVNSILFR